MLAACGDEAAPIECTCNEAGCAEADACAVQLMWPRSCFDDGSSWSVGLEGGSGLVLDAENTWGTACTGVSFEDSATLTVDAPPSGWPDAVAATCFTRGGTAEVPVCPVAFNVSPGCTGSIEAWDVSIDDQPVGTALLRDPLEPCLFVAEGESRAFVARGGGLVSSGTIAGCGAAGGTLVVTLSCQ